MLIHLDSRALLKISGTDSVSFLQSQLSNDISQLNDSSIQLNAYCQHQGKIIALFWVMRFGDDFLLSFPNELSEIVKARLQMFILMSEVEVIDVKNEYEQIGIIDDPNNDFYSINERLSLMITTKENLEHYGFIPKEYWDKVCIELALPDIYLLTSEKLVPQMLNLDIDEVGVNFSKGCYPGQEVVARLHYLGSAKRRLFAFESEAEINIGESLYCASSKSAKDRGARYKGSGMVVFRIKYNSKFYCLASLEVELKDEAVTLNNEQGPELKRIQK